MSSIASQTIFKDGQLNITDIPSYEATNPWIMLQLFRDISNQQLMWKYLSLTCVRNVPSDSVLCTMIPTDSLCEAAVVVMIVEGRWQFLS